MPRTDAEILEDVAARIRGLGPFRDAAVVLGCGPGDEELPPEYGAAAWVQRAGWRNADRGTDEEGIRELTIRIWIDAWGEDPQGRQGMLLDLEARVCAALDGKALGGFAMPAFTRVVSGQDSARPAFKASRTLLTLATRYRRIGG